MRSRRRFTSSCLVVAAAVLAASAGSLSFLLATSPPASASSNGSWSIYPYRPPGTFGSGRGIFDYSVKPGQTISDEATVSNYTNNPLDFYIYSGDGYNVKVGGGFAIQGRGEKNRQVGTWIQLPGTLNTVFTLPARTAANIPFELQVPPNAAPGDHAGGIVALDVTPQNQVNGQVKVAVHRGVGVRVYVTVLGPRHPGLDVTNIDSHASIPAMGWVNGRSAAYPQFKVSDIGNTIFNAVEVKAYATNIFGRRVKTFPTKFLEGMLPGDSGTVVEPKWSSLPVAGPISIHVDLTAAGVKQGFSGAFWIVPWILVLIVVAVLLLVVLFWRWRRRRRGRSIAPEPAPKTDEPVASTVG